MRVPRRCSLTTTPRRRSSASPAETVAGLRETSCARRLTDGSGWPGMRRPSATASSIERTRPAALCACIRYCIISHRSVLLQIGGDVTSEPPGPSTAAPPSERVRLRRKRERGSYERETIDAILDEALIAHLGIVDGDGQPLVIPTLHARSGDVVYCHGSIAARTLRTLAAGAPVCLTVSPLDGRAPSG